MYKANNRRELKKLLKEGKSPIEVTDPKTIKTIEIMDQMKKKGISATAKDEIESFLRSLVPIHNLTAGGTVIIVGMSLVTLIVLYGIYKEMDVEIETGTTPLGKRILILRIKKRK